MKRLFFLIALTLTQPAFADYQGGIGEVVDGLGDFIETVIHYDKARAEGLPPEEALIRASSLLAAGVTGGVAGGLLGRVIIGGAANYFLPDNPLREVATAIGTFASGVAGAELAQAAHQTIFDNLDLRRQLIALLDQRYTSLQPYYAELASWQERCADDHSYGQLQCDPSGEMYQLTDKMSEINHSFCLNAAAEVIRYFPDRGQRYLDSCNS
jgi:hypothetical protein